MSDSNLELINSILPPDVWISLNEAGLYEWSFRCMSFEDYANEAFKTPVEALAHLTKIIIEQDDEMYLEEPVDDDSEGARFWPDPYMSSSYVTSED